MREFRICNCGTTEQIIYQLSQELTAQIMDTVMNAPFKAGLRQRRLKDIYEEFRIYKTQLADDILQGKRVRPFRPSTPDRFNTIQDVFGVLTEMRESEEFMASLRKGFQSRGFILTEGTEGSPPFFRRYTIQTGFGGTTVKAEGKETTYVDLTHLCVSPDFAFGEIPEEESGNAGDEEGDEDNDESDALSEESEDDQEGI